MNYFNEEGMRWAAGEYHRERELGAGIKPNGGTHAARLDVICLADVKPKPIEWLWKFWIAIGKVSVLAGDGGQASQLSCVTWPRERAPAICGQTGPIGARQAAS